MLKYIIKRILLLIPIMLCVVLVVYALLYSSVSANKQAISSRGDGDWLDKTYERLGIQDTFAARYIRFCYKALIKLDFGNLNNTNVKLLDNMMQRLKFTLKLTFWSFILATVLGIALGMASAINREGWGNNIFMLLITLVSSVPSYTLALVLALLFTVKLHLLPSFGIASPKAFIMPSIALAVGGIASTARVTRASAIEVMDQQYVTALRAKGLKERSVIYIHVLKNSLMPVLANLGTVFAQLICGSMVVERFFSIPGLGVLLLSAVNSRDNQILMGVSVVFAFLLTTANLITDLLYTVVNPRVRAQYVGGRKRGKA